MSMKSHIVSTYNDRIRPRLPATDETKSVAGIEITSERYRRHWFDEFVPIPTPYERYLKHRNVQLIRDGVKPAEVGISIGGGYGVTAAALAEQVKSLHVYEGSMELIEEIKRNFDANGIEATVHEAIVGEAIVVDGTPSAKVISPSSLPDADVIEMDCEGAEIPILSAITSPPDQFVVETHPSHGAPTDAVVDRLQSLGHIVQATVPDPVDGDILITKS